MTGIGTIAKEEMTTAVVRNPLEGFVLLAKGAKGAACLELSKKVLEAPGDHVFAMQKSAPNDGSPTKKRKVTEELATKNSTNQAVHNFTKEFKKWSAVRQESQSKLPTQNENPNAVKIFKRQVSIQRSPLKFEDIGGMDRVLNELCDLLMHIKHPEVYRHIGLSPARGFLLHGPPGCGKKLLANAIAGQLDVCMIHVTATELVADVSGESEERIRDLFEQAYAVAPCVLFIDEIDVIASNRIKSLTERHIVAQLLSSFDSLSKCPEGDQVLVIGATTRPDALDPALRRVGRFDQEISLGIPDRAARASILRIICTKLKLNRPIDYDAVAALTSGYVGADLLALAKRAASIAIKRVFRAKDEGILRCKPFRTTSFTSNSIPIVDLTEDTILDETKRITEKQANAMMDLIDDNLMSLIDAALKTTEQDEAMDVSTDKPSETQLAKVTDKCMEVIDLDDLPDEETLTHRNDSVELEPCALNNVSINITDFTYAIKLVQPSAEREGFVTVPDVTWDDIGSLRDIREALQLAVLAPMKYPGKLLALGLQCPSGVLLFGPPGCGKRLLAKAVANEASINFISFKGSELAESENAVRMSFQRARNSAPCVIFFDEFDSLCPARSGASENNGSSRVLNQFLTEMDGVDDRKGVFLMAATNRPEIVDPAVQRPGRLDKILYVGMPERNDRAEILQALTKKKPTLAVDVDIQELAMLAENYTGADLVRLLRQASLLAHNDSNAAPLFTPQDASNKTSIPVNRNHFLKALRDIRPSVSAEDKEHYAKLRQKYERLTSETN